MLFWDTENFFRDTETFFGTQNPFFGKQKFLVDQNPRTSHKLQKNIEISKKRRKTIRKSKKIFLIFSIFFNFSCLSNILI